MSWIVSAVVLIWFMIIIENNNFDIIAFTIVCIQCHRLTIALAIGVAG